MSQTPSKPVGSQTNSPFTPTKRGLLEDGTWLCDCTPRTPAICRTVRKETPNKGRRFWTCDNWRCGFFLWESDAEERERDALLKYNCRSENGITTRVQGKEEAPPGLDMRAQQARNGGSSISGSSGGGMTRASVRSPQRIFRGLPPRRNGGSFDSDSLSISDDDEDLIARDLDIAAAGAGRPAASETHTLRNSSSSGSKSAETRATAGHLGNTDAEELSSSSSSRMPGFSFQAPGGNPTTPSAKRKRTVFQEDSEDEFGDAELEDPDTEQQLAAMADESARKQRQLQTQGLARSLLQKDATAAANTGGTPPPPTRSNGMDAHDVEHNGGLPTPRTNRNSLLIKAEERGRGAKRQRTVGFAALPGEEEDSMENMDNRGGTRRAQNGVGEEDEDDPDGVIGDGMTPTPYRKTDALAAVMPSGPTTPTSRSAAQSHQAAAAVPQTPGGGSSMPMSTSPTPTTPSKRSDYPKIADHIRSILIREPISEAKRHTVDAALEQHERLVKGVVRGRDAARAKLQDRDARIAELQARVASLENARRLDRAILGDAKEVLSRLTQQAEDDQVET